MGFALSQNGQFLATRDGTGKVKIWPWSWQTLSALRDARAFTASPIQTVDLEQDRISSMSFSPDNASLTTTDQDGTLSIQPLRDSRKQSPSFESFQAQVRQVLLSPDASRICHRRSKWHCHHLEPQWATAQLYFGHFKKTPPPGLPTPVLTLPANIWLWPMKMAQLGCIKCVNLNDLIDQGVRCWKPYRQEYMEVNEVC